MKRTIFVASIALLTLGLVRPQLPHPYRVVFDLTSRDTLDQRAVLRWIREITTTAPDAKLEVVMYARGFELVMKQQDNWGYIKVGH